MMRMAPRMAPAIWVRPPTTAMVRQATMMGNSIASGETTRMVCAYRAPARPANMADNKNIA